MKILEYKAATEKLNAISKELRKENSARRYRSQNRAFKLISESAKRSPETAQCLCVAVVEEILKGEIDPVKKWACDIDDFIYVEYELLFNQTHLTNHLFV